MEHRQHGEARSIWILTRQGPREVPWAHALGWLRAGKVPHRTSARLDPDEPWRPIEEILEVRVELAASPVLDPVRPPEARRPSRRLRLLLPIGAAVVVVLGLAGWLALLARWEADAIRKFESEARAELESLRRRIEGDRRAFEAELEQEAEAAETLYAERLKAARREQEERLSALRTPHEQKLEAMREEFESEVRVFKRWIAREDLRDGRLAAEKREKEWARRSACGEEFGDSWSEKRVRRLYRLARDGTTPAQTVLEEVADDMCLGWEKEMVSRVPGGYRLDLDLDLREVDLDEFSTRTIEPRTMKRETHRQVGNTLRRILWLAGPHRPVLVQVRVLDDDGDPAFALTLDAGQIASVGDWSRVGWERVLEVATITKDELHRYAGWLLTVPVPR